ncbi:MAG: hypothetical protein ACKOSO_01335, partial [Actinomycetota bacterium]
ARWWVVAICVIAAVALSYALSGTEDRKLTRAAATVFLGQPVTPNGALTAFRDVAPVAPVVPDGPLVALLGLIRPYKGAQGGWQADGGGS